MADETVVPVERLPFTGEKFQDVRTARNHAARDGVRAVWTTWAECGPLLRTQILALSEEWVASKALPEMGFTVGGLGQLADDGVRLMLAEDADGRLHGVTSWMLDFMRRSTTGFRPVVEFLIAATLEQADADGLGWISLSGAPLVRNGAVSDEPLDGVLTSVGHALEPVYGFRSLAAFKAKFAPVDTPWVMSYQAPAALPAIGRALAAAYVPDMSMVDVSRAARKLVRRSGKPAVQGA